MTEQFKVLVVDDHQFNLDLLAGILKDDHYHLSTAISGKSAMEHLSVSLPDLILLDIVMPGMDGYDICKLIKDDVNFQHIPIIFITAETSSISIKKAFSLGGADYITKPVNVEEVLARVNNQEKLINYQKQQWNFIKQTEKMAEMGELVAALTHEVANPIGNSNLTIDSVQNSMQMIFEDLKAKSLSQNSLQQYLTSINKSLQHCRNNNMQAFSLLSGLKNVAIGQSNHRIKEFNLLHLLEDIISTLKPKLKKLANPVQVKVDETISVNSYSGALSQVINNLINNSILHGFIDDKQDKGQISISATVENNMINLVYQDNGIGMDEIELKNALQRFYTTKENNGGSGLGLPICDDIIKNDLLGHFRIESTKNEGVTCYISIKSDLADK